MLLCVRITSYEIAGRDRNKIDGCLVRLCGGSVYPRLPSQRQNAIVMADLCT